MSNNEDLTPLMRQFWDLKAQSGDALLLFRMGDFYELFGDDAVVAAKILEITLTTRDKNKANAMPMAGVPYHALQAYLPKLLKAGKKVAIGEQVEDPATVKGKAIVRREITRIFTPAVQFESEGVEAAYLAVALPEGSKWHLACLDSSTGEALVSGALDEKALAQELAELPVRHLLRVGHDLPEAVVNAARAQPSTLVEDIPSNYLSEEQALRLLKKSYGLENLAAFIPSDTVARALGVLVTYAARTQLQDKLAHLRLPRPLHKPRSLAYGPRTAQHLDLFPNAEGGPNLYQLVNKTRSSLGARALRRWLAEPLQAPREICARQESVRELATASSYGVAEKLSSELAEIYDLERIAGRVIAKLANPRDTLALGKSLATLPRLAEKLAGVGSPLLVDMRSCFEQLRLRLETLSERILRTQREDAPLVARDGGIFSKGTTPELDRLIGLTDDGQRWLVELETREREQTGIPSLKVRYNRVFGYYIEVTSAHLKNVPDRYQRKQTMVGAERFFTEELKKFEDEIVNASSRQKAMEQQLFEELLSAIEAEIPSIMDAARAFGELDALLSLSLLAQEPGWTFPVIDESLELEIEGGRHPLVDQAARGSFVPNDLRLSPSDRLTLLITGPNMGGKSTVMRQAALIVILGQVGAPVPAARARWGAVTSLYTRIGAHDAIARGQSTFMVEMSELAHILHNADERSLIVLDEIGRGTSTYDGISVAWATLEWIATQIRARTLFATHYHELTKLTKTLPRVANAHMAVAQDDAGGLRFLYQLREGPTNESFGVHVAKLAGLPAAVVERAWQVLADLEKGAGAKAPTPDLEFDAEDWDERAAVEARPSVPGVRHATPRAPARREPGRDQLSLL